MRVAMVLVLTLLSAAAPAQSCRQELGPQRSQTMVNRCIDVSPATHPPCNASNPCDLIRAEIVRSCAMLKSPGRPAWCGEYR